MAVTTRDKVTAVLQARDAEAIVERGMRDVNAWLVLLNRAVIDAYLAGFPPQSVTEKSFRVFGALLVESMSLGHILGVKRTRAQLPKRVNGTFQAGIHTRTIAFLRQQLNLPQSEIDRIVQQYGSAPIQAVDIAQRDLERSLFRTMVQIRQEHVHVRDGAKLLRETMARAGFTPRNSYQAETIYRTQTQLAYSAGTWAQEQDPDIWSEIWGYKYVTVGDIRVRPSHQGLEGVTLPKEHPWWNQNRPPNGYNCRCQVITLFDEQPIKLPPNTATAYTPTGPKENVPQGADPGFQFHPGQLHGGAPPPPPPRPKPPPPAPKPRPIPRPKTVLPKLAPKTTRKAAAAKKAEEFKQFRSQFRADTAGLDIGERLTKATHLDEIVKSMRAIAVEGEELDSLKYAVEKGKSQVKYWTRVVAEEGRGHERLEKWRKLLEESQQLLDDFHKLGKGGTNAEAHKLLANWIKDKGKPIQFKGTTTTRPVPGATERIAKVEKVTKRGERAEKWFSKMVLEDERLQKMHYTREVAFDDLRAFANSSQRRIVMAVNDGVDVHVHEMAHILETNRPGGTEAANQFLHYRVRTSPPEGRVGKRFREVFPNVGYEPDEWGYKDRFQDWYTGKIYGSTHTEVLSMGFQELYRNPLGLVRDDPEFFKFLCGIMDGTLCDPRHPVGTALKSWNARAGTLNVLRKGTAKLSAPVRSIDKLEKKLGYKRRPLTAAQWKKEVLADEEVREAILRNMHSADPAKWAAMTDSVGRNRFGSDWARRKKEGRAVVEALKKAYAMRPSNKKQLLLYRGLHSLSPKYAEEIARSDTFLVQHWSASSPNKHIVSKFTTQQTERWERWIELRLKTRSGMNISPLAPKQYAREQEYTLPAGLLFRITGRKEVRRSGKLGWVVDAEEI